ncbi:MAG: hypothetical protein JW891_06140 [Candidatus Lokiarchaeota archaeon]|nr:hypothetical protein [Candidatus Lokiarchaeota archaeon]
MFSNYSKIKKVGDETIKELFVNDSILKLIEVAKDIKSDVFFQNALTIVSCLYHDENLDNFQNEGKSSKELDSEEKDELALILKSEFL